MPESKLQNNTAVGGRWSKWQGSGCRAMSMAFATVHMQTLQPLNPVALQAAQKANLESEFQGIHGRKSVGGHSVGVFVYGVGR